MVRFYNNEGLSYNDIGIVPSIGVVKSRKEIPIEGYRIIVAGMSSIIGEEFLKEWAALPEQIRPLIHIPRDKDSIRNLKFIVKNKLQEWTIVGIGINTLEIENFAFKNNFTNILLDIAFGGLPQIENVYNRLRMKFGDKASLICGSISTPEQAHYLESMGWNCLRTNVAVGNACATKNVSGIYMGAVTEILNVRSYLGDENSTTLLADGGFKQICDVSKAFLLGADYIMSGYLFTKCKSAQLNVDGSKEYFGMSNPKKGLGKSSNFDESFERKIDNKELYSLYDLLMKIWSGIRSAVSYSGYSSLSNAIGNGEFIVLKTPLKSEENW